MQPEHAEQKDQEKAKPHRQGKDLTGPGKGGQPPRGHPSGQKQRHGGNQDGGGPERIGQAAANPGRVGSGQVETPKEKEARQNPSRPLSPSLGNPLPQISLPQDGASPQQRHQSHSDAPPPEWDTATPPRPLRTGVLAAAPCPAGTGPGRAPSSVGAERLFGPSYIILLLSPFQDGASPNGAGRHAALFSMVTTVARSQ